MSELPQDILDRILSGEDRRELDAELRAELESSEEGRELLLNVSLSEDIEGLLAMMPVQDVNIQDLQVKGILEKTVFEGEDDPEFGVAKTRFFFKGL